MMGDDASLIRLFVREASEAAFAELVRRHVHLVHSAALRQLGGDEHRAQDVTQAVFCELARKAPKLLHHCALSGWLYTTTRFVGARVQRSEARRSARELASHPMPHALDRSATDLNWSDLAPVLDAAMGQLGDKDRYAIVLRFFENRPLAEVGARLGLTENAARMRVERAIEKLRKVLARRGITSTGSVLGTVLLANAVTPAPSTLAATLVGPALVSAAASTASSAGSVIGLIQAMNTAKLGIGIAAIAIAAAPGTHVASQRTSAKLRAEITTLQSAGPTTVPLPSDNRLPAVGASDADELSRLRTEHTELLRLRGEIGVLRQDEAELARLRAEQAEREKAAASKAAEDQARKAKEQVGFAKMNFTRAWGRAFQLFARENGGRMPENFEQAASYLQQAEAQYGASPGSTEDFDIVFHGSLADIQAPGRTIILREKQPFNVQPSGEAWRTYLFADGHSEVHVAQDGNFESWEKEHTGLAVSTQP